ncbi:MAG: zinc-binding dehydrogenase, partial [Pseudomonadales bacterium]|nr:zinc-binding dehydrogenase [Pseudomonadales bacterium]
ADAVIVSGRDDYVTMLHEFSQQKGSDLVFDAVAGPQSRELIRGARRGSTIVIHGMLDRKPMDVHAGVLMKRWLSLRGYRVDSLLADKTCLEKAVRQIENGVSSGVFKPEISSTFSLSEFKHAFVALRGNKHIGKIVITP